MILLASVGLFLLLQPHGICCSVDDIMSVCQVEKESKGMKDEQPESLLGKPRCSQKFYPVGILFCFIG